MKTYVIGNLKGGVGKTTSAVNLAYSMSSLGKRVLVIDLDPQTNLTPFYGKVTQTGHTVQDVLHDFRKVKRAIYRSKYPNIDIIRGNTELKEADASTPDILKNALDRVKEQYDICMIDTRPAFETLTLNAIFAADVLLTPVCLDKFCRDNLLLVEDILQELDCDIDWKIFANKVENKKSQRNTYVDMVQYHSLPIMETCISKSAAVENALEYYKPIVRHRSKCQAAQDYLDLAQELLEG